MREPKLLALDTSTEACSAAIRAGGELLGKRFEIAPRRHAELILPMIESILAESGLGLHELDCIAFGRGPGSFTGVRIAAAVSQAIAFSASLPVVPVSTLAALAMQVMRRHGADQVMTAIDARMGEIYWGLYAPDSSQGVRAVTSEQVAKPQTLAPLTLQTACVLHGAGSGWQTYCKLLQQKIAADRVWPELYPDAADIAYLAGYAYQSGNAVSAEQALPVYLRDNVTAS